MSGNSLRVLKNVVIANVAMRPDALVPSIVSIPCFRRPSKKTMLPNFIFGVHCRTFSPVGETANVETAALVLDAFVRDWKCVL